MPVTIRTPTHSAAVPRPVVNRNRVPFQDAPPIPSELEQQRQALLSMRRNAHNNGGRTLAAEAFAEVEQERASAEAQARADYDRNQRMRNYRVATLPVYVPATPPKPIIDEGVGDSRNISL